jgi:hypothetical protein
VKGRRLLALLAMIAVSTLLPSPATAASSRPAAPTTAAPLPVLAYYYIWFNASSWNRAKHDYPSLGRYTSDEASVMRKHIREARSAGITGFLVSWKDTPVLDERLDKLVQVAREEKFSLGIVYQGLDVKRDPLPVGKVLHDMQLFSTRWGKDSVFHIYDRPLMVWTGTWRFSLADLTAVSKAVRPSLQLLASEQNVDRWSQVGPLVDGDAYYYSSVDPGKDHHAAYKLKKMSAAVHATHGLWIAPAAPGFDARLIGGTRNVSRNNGATLKTEWANALASSPDALGLISWNEFTESTYVEPSRSYGSSALKTVAALTGTPGPRGELDSSLPVGRSSASPWRAALIALLLGGMAVVAGWRSRRRQPPALTLPADLWDTDRRGEAKIGAR